MNATALEPKTTLFLNEHSKICPNWPKDSAVFWVLICTVHLTVYSCHITDTVQKKSTLYSCLNLKELLATSRHEIWTWSGCNWTRTHNHIVLKRTHNHLPQLTKDWAVFWVLICRVHLTTCSCHITYAVRSESTLYSCMNLKELLARRRREIYRWSGCNWTLTQNQKVLNGKLKHLAELTKGLSFVLSTYLYGAFDCMFLSCQVRGSEWINNLLLPECQKTPC